jgi:hypothetical protein
MPADPRGKPKATVQRAMWVEDMRMDPPSRIAMDGWDWEMVEEDILDNLIQHGYTKQWLRVSREIRTFLKHELGEQFKQEGYSEAITTRESMREER